MDELLSAREFCESVAGNDLYQWKIDGFLTEKLLILKRNAIPLVIRYKPDKQSERYEWYTPQRLKEIKKELGLDKY